MLLLIYLDSFNLSVHIKIYILLINIDKVELLKLKLKLLGPSEVYWVKNWSCSVNSCFTFVSQQSKHSTALLKIYV